MRSRPVIAPMELAISCELPDASSSSPEIAEERPVARGSMVWCQPSSVRSTQSSRLTARGAEDACVAGKTVASLSQRSVISKALATTLTSFVPIGSEPWSCTNFFAVSLTTFLGSASVLPPVNAANGLTKPAGFIPICSNCFWICSCIWRIIAEKSSGLLPSSSPSFGVNPKGDMCNSSFHYC